MRGRILGAFLSSAVIAAFAAWIASLPGLPGQVSVDLSQPGPYAVGTATAQASRTMPDGQVRSLQVHLWYPSGQNGTPLATVAPRQIAAAGAPLPLVIFSPGTGAYAAEYSFLLSHLASHGFVVAGLDDEECRPSCTDLGRAIDADHRPADVSMVLDYLLAQNASDHRLFKGLVDPERVGVAGQSFGGWTTLRVLAGDPRFRAGLAMNPGTLDQPYADPRTIAKSLMLMAGALDARVPYALTAGYFADIPASAPAHYLLTVQQAGHEFHNVCPNGFVTTSCASSMPHEQLQSLVKRVGTAFLLKHGAGRPITDAQLGLNDATTEYQLVKAPTDAPGVAPTPRPLVSAAATPSAVAGTTLLEDVLSQPDGGKLPPSSADPGRFTAGYANGQYEIALNRTPGQGEVLLPGTYADASIAVDVEMVNPTPNQFAQLACRVGDAVSQYRFAFNPATGNALLVRWLPVAGHEVNRISLVPLQTHSPGMHLGSAVNHAELSCRGTTITARLNGTVVASVTDNSLAEGQLWIATGESVGTASPGPKPTARFSNLVVRQE